MHILVIRPGAIGDTLLTFPVLDALRTLYAPSQLTFVGNAAVLPLVKTLGLAEAVYDYEEPRWGALFTTHPSRLDSQLGSVVQGITMAVVWLRDPEGIVAQKLRTLGINNVIVAPGRPAEHEPQHIVEYLARSVQLAIPSPSSYAARLPVVKDNSIPHWIAVHPGSGGVRKCWPLEYFAAVIQALWQHDYPVLLLAGPAEQERLATLLALLPSVPDPALLKTLVNVPLLTLAQTLCTCRAYLGNDAGITHLAALLGVPTLALFGPTDPLIWRPYGKDVCIMQAPAADLRNLSPTVVIPELESLFANMD